MLAIVLMPSFLGEAHFNMLSHALSQVRTPQRREFDYVRQVAASADTAKEVKIFGLSAFLIDRYRVISRDTYDATDLDILAASDAAYHLGTIDTAAATWAFDTGMAAGKGSGALAASEWLFQPLKAGGRVLGVLALPRIRRPIRCGPINCPCSAVYSINPRS